MSTHKYPAELTPDQAEGIERAIEGIRSILTQAYISARSHERLLQEVSATPNRVRAERDTAVAEQHRLMRGMVNAGRELDAAHARIAELERQYLSAVSGRAKFREAFKRERAKGKAAREWMETYAGPLLKELEGYQNGDPNRALYTNRIAELERQLGETQAALAVAEDAQHPLAQ